MGRVMGVDCFNVREVQKDRDKVKKVLKKVLTIFETGDNIYKLTRTAPKSRLRPALNLENDTDKKETQRNDSNSE